MNEDEFYFEDVSPSKAKIICIVIIVIIGFGIAGYFIYSRMYSFNIKEKVVYELGSTLNKDIAYYLNNKPLDESDYTISFGSVSRTEDILDEVGEYTYKIKYHNITKKGKIIVKDTVAPLVQVQDLTIGVNEEYEIDDFITSCEDYSKPCEVTYKNTKDSQVQKKAGTYSFDIVISDTYDNKTTKKVQLNVRDGYSYEEVKANDLTIDHTSINHDDWQNVLFIKYDSAIDENKLDEDERYLELLNLTSTNMNSYLPSNYQGSNIINQEIIYVYNKYNYIIGFAVRVELSDNTILYLSK